MELLILLRHAKAVGETEAPDDRSRALADKGRADAPLAGAAMAEQGFRPERALVSAATRTRETWALAGPVLGDPPAEHREALYMADADRIWDEATRAGAERVIVVAHNPGIHALAATLLHQARDRSKLARTVLDGMAPGAWAAFSIAGGPRLASANATLVGAWSPKAS